MTHSPTITVITPTFNQARYLERTICSVLDQGYDRLEFIVVDGGSIDGSQEIIQMYENELAWWISVNDGGPASAINKAMQHVTGDLVAFLSSDNVLMPFALEEVAQQWRQHGRPAWICGGTAPVNADDEELPQESWPAPRDLADYLRGDCDPLPGCASFYRADALREHGPLREALQHNFLFEFNCRLMATGVRPVTIPTQLAAERRHRAALRNRDTMARRRERRTIVQQYLQVLHRQPEPVATLNVTTGTA